MNDLPSLVGISGKAQAGKDTLAAMVATQLQFKKRVVRIGFADALKEECARVYGWNGAKDEAGRALLQRVGVERREQDPLYWVKRAFEKMTDPDTLYVVPDVRFKNEAEAIRAKSGEVWRVDRFDPTTMKPFDNGLAADAKLHVSETELDRYMFDVYFLNDTLDSLRAQVREVLDDGSD